MYLQSVKKANNQLNAISRIGAVLGQEEKEILTKLFCIFQRQLRPSYMALYNQKLKK